MSLTVTREALLCDGGDALFRQVIHDSLSFSIRLQEIRNRLGASIGLSGPAYSALIAIQHLGQTGEVGITRLAQHLHLSPAFVTIEVAKLVKAGLVLKEGDPDDGRRVVLRATDKAEKLLASLAVLQRPVNDTIFAGLSAGQFRMFAETVAQLVAGTEQALALAERAVEDARRRA
jgi:DNA-binding MarR family transcriptional regulator